MLEILYFKTSFDNFVILSFKTCCSYIRFQKTKFSSTIKNITWHYIFTELCNISSLSFIRINLETNTIRISFQLLHISLCSHFLFCLFSTFIFHGINVWQKRRQYQVPLVTTNFQRSIFASYGIALAPLPLPVPYRTKSQQ